MGYLALTVRIIGFILYSYVFIIAIYFLLGWITEIRRTRFYSFLYRIVYPFERIFGGKLIIGGTIDIGETIGLILLSVIAQLIISVSYYI